MRVRDRDRRVLFQKQVGGGSADHRAAPDHHGARAAKRHAVELQELHHRLGGGRDEARTAVGEKAHVEGIHPLHVLLDGDVVDDVSFVERSGERREQEHAVHRRLRSELLERLRQLALSGVASERDVVDRDVEPLAVVGEPLHVHVRSGVPTRRYRGEAGRDPVRVQRVAALPRPRVDQLRQRLPVQEPH